MRSSVSFYSQRIACVAAVVAAVALLPSDSTTAATSAASSDGASKPTSLRISPSQYQQIIADVFGFSITITGRFEPELRDEGLAAVGAARASFSDAGIERYDELARGIASQVVDEKHRKVLIHCQPKNARASDDECARTFLQQTGRLLYRRPLAENELSDLVEVASESANTLSDFYTGIGSSVATMLISPDFLFRYKDYEVDPSESGRYRMDAFSKAAALSFFLWNSTPDDLLLKAAETGELHTADGLRKQVERMIASPSLENGVRAFFRDMLDFEKFEVVSKDPAFFPKFTSRVKEDAQEQTLRTIVDHLIKRQGDYRDLFVTPHTYLTRSLAALYGVPLVEKTDNGQPMHWYPFTYAKGDPRAGLISQASFVALHSPAGRTSPTDRGKALRELILCQAVPAPPGNVNFTLAEDVSNPKYKTTRERLTAHRSEPVCAGCHRITDPMGFALENFDSSGAFRTTENGEIIDTSGELSGAKFVGAAGLAETLRNEPAVTSCVAKRAFAFAAGATPPRNDEWVKIENRFAESKYNFPSLLREIALSGLLYEVSMPDAGATKVPVE